MPDLIVHPRFLLDIDSVGGGGLCSLSYLLKKLIPFSDAPYYVRSVSTYQENPYPHLFCFNNNTTYWTNLKPGRFGEK